MPRFAYGGQALMEGVLMRGQHAIGVAVRGPDGRIFGAQENLDSVLHRNRFARAPFFRGVVLLYETLVIGTRWLMRSGSLAAAGEGVAMGGATLVITLLVTLGVAIGIFVLLPLFLAQGAVSGLLSGFLTSIGVPAGLLPIIQHLIEGLFRVLLFVGYLLVVSRSAEIRRVFQYHGAEHMTIHALEHDDPLTIERDPQVPHRAPALRHRVPGRVHHRQHHPVQRAGRHGAVGRPGRPHPAHPGGRRGRATRSCAGVPSAARTGRCAGCSCRASGCRPSPPSSPMTR